MQQETQTPWEMGSQWLGRALAVVLLIALSGMAGSQVDQWLETKLFTPLGFLLGLFAGLAGLLVIANRLTPPARGEPLPWPEDEVSDEQELEEKSASSRK